MTSRTLGVAFFSLLLSVACSRELSPPALSVSPAPWPAPRDASARIQQAGLPGLPTERFEHHVHAHLDVFVNGAAVPVPAGIGIDRKKKVISPLHTHEKNGIIHIESAVPATFTLGQFFTQWGVRLDERCVGAYCEPTTPVRLYVNGSERPGDLPGAPLGNHDQLALVIGRPPAHVPATYVFPGGL